MIDFALIGYVGSLGFTLFYAVLWSVSFVLIPYALLKRRPRLFYGALMVLLMVSFNLMSFQTSAMASGWTVH